ncbi:hypothetical protein ABFS83_12G036800 [Erythranthe nasuta]
MSSDLCGPSLLLALPDDIFSIIASTLSPRDLCSLGVSCPGLNDVVSSDKVWFAQCNKFGLLPLSTLIEWRQGVSSYKALCRFLVNIHPLMGIWVHKYPLLGNLVYVMPGFLSVVGCRIIPQKIGRLGLENDPILWTPVFEILCKYDGSTAFFLHGREEGADYVYPGLLKSVDRNCNVLLLEVEPRDQQDEIEKDVSQKGTERSFIHLDSEDKEKLLDFVTSQVRDIVPDAANVLFFPRSRNDEAVSERDFAVLCERRLLLLQMYNRFNMNHDLASQAGEGDRSHCIKGKTLFQFLKNGLKQLLRQSRSTNGDRKYLKPHEFLGPHDMMGLSLRAKAMELRYIKHALKCPQVYPLSINCLFGLPRQVTSMLVYGEGRSVGHHL